MTPKLAQAIADLDTPAEPLLLRYQRRWLDDPAEVKVAVKSRRVGLTYATASMAVIEASSGRTDVIYQVFSEENAKLFIDDCVGWCRRLESPFEQCEVELVGRDDDGRDISFRALGISFPGSDKKIIALASAPRGLRGRAGIVVIDEAAHHPDLQGALAAAIGLLIWGSQILVLSSAGDEGGAFDNLCNEIRDGKRPDWSLHTVDIETALADGLYRRICEAKNDTYSKEAEAAWLAKLVRQYAPHTEQELYCRPSSGGTSYLPRELVKACMRTDLPVLRFYQEDSFARLSEEQRHEIVSEWLEAQVAPLLDRLNADPDCRASAFGYDVARYGDLAVLAPVYIRQNLTKRFPFLLEMSRVTYNSQWHILEYVAKRLPRFFHGAVDSTGTGSWLGEQAHIHLGGDGFIERVALSTAFYKTWWPPARHSFEMQAVELPQDADVLRDLLVVRRVNGVPSIPAARAESDVVKGQLRHGDAAIAIMLALTAAAKAEQTLTSWDAYSTL